MTNSSQTVPRKDPGDEGFLQALWGFFSSMKTAITLLLVLAVASIAGTVIPQGVMPEELKQHYGRWYRLIHALVLDDVYTSWWYVGLLVLVGINLAVCSWRRFGATWRRVTNPQVVATAKQVSAMQRSESLSSKKSVNEAAEGLETALRSSSYHVMRVQDSGEGVFYAVKGRASIWGPYMTHVSILVIFIGAVLGSKLGYMGRTRIMEGGYTDTCYVMKKDTAEEKKLGFRVELRSFRIGYDRHHNPTSYRSDLEVFEGDKAVAHKVIDVNHPLSYKGVSFYQTDFGLHSLVLKVTAPNGDIRAVTFPIQTQEGPGGKEYAITSASGDMAFEHVMVGGKKLTILAHEFAPDYVGGKAVNASDLPLHPAALIMVNDRLPEYKGIDAWKKLGWLGESKSAKFRGFTITLESVVRYSVLQVGRNPGLPIVYAGFCLILVGVFVSFYVTRKVIRVRISPSDKGASVLIGGNSRSDPSVFDGDFARLKDALK